MTVQVAVLAQAILLYVRSTTDGDRGRTLPFR